MTMTISNLLAECIMHNASDLHLSAGCFPMLRVDGRLRKLEIEVISQKWLKTGIDDLMNESERQRFSDQKEIDFAFSDPTYGRFRVNCFHQSRGVSCVLRRISTEMMTLEQLQGPPIFHEIIRKKQGLIVVTGATGSGKSTTLAAMIEHINQTTHQHILTIEDPIEYLYTPELCLIQQRQVGVDTPSFHSALRSALREDPDIILIGELRDLATIRLALTAAETGHLVFATLHTRSAARTIDRIVDVFPEAEQERVVTQLSDSLHAVIAQQLLPLKGGGRVGCFEVLISTPAIANLIKERRNAQIDSMIQTGSAHGMCTMAQNKVRLKALKFEFLEERSGGG